MKDLITLLNCFGQRRRPPTTNTRISSNEIANGTGPLPAVNRTQAQSAQSEVVELDIIDSVGPVARDDNNSTADAGSGARESDALEAPTSTEPLRLDTA